MAGSRISPWSSYRLRIFAGPAFLILLAVSQLGCVRPGPQAAVVELSPTEQEHREPAPTAEDQPQADVSETEPTPTPNEHVVLLGETLNTIAEQYLSLIHI